MSKDSRRGFSLIEALVAVAIAAVGLTAAFGAMKSLATAERRSIRSEIMQRLALQKFDEVVATGEIDTAPLEGNFEDRGIAGFEWNATVDQSGTENLEIITVIVNPTLRSDNLEARITGLRYVPAVTTEGQPQ